MASSILLVHIYIYKRWGGGSVTYDFGASIQVIIMLNSITSLNLAFLERVILTMSFKTFMFKGFTSVSIRTRL